MLLAIDIGNTNISLGIFSATKAGGFNKNYGKKINRLKKRFDIATKHYKQERLKNALRGISIDDAIICSVVPKITDILEKDCKRLFGIKPYVLGKNITVPIKNLYRRPKQVGQDRLVNAYAGIMLYGAPLIAVDFGTAITFDVISGKKEYLGGLILSGLQLSLDALAERTALLPKIKLKKPEEFIGRTTKTSMLSGVVYGAGVITDELVRSLKKRLGKFAQVIATGGDIDLVAKFCRKIDKIEKDLTLKGLGLIYNEISKRKRFQRLNYSA